jgi:hypothetical protein
MALLIIFPKTTPTQAPTPLEGEIGAQRIENGSYPIKLTPDALSCRDGVSVIRLHA